MLMLIWVCCHFVNMPVLVTSLLLKRWWLWWLWKHCWKINGDPVNTVQTHGFIWISEDSNGYSNTLRFVRKKYLIIHDRLSAVRQHETRAKLNKNYFNMGSRNLRLENVLCIRNVETWKRQNWLQLRQQKSIVTLFIVIHIDCLIITKKMRNVAFQNSLLAEVKPLGNTKAPYVTNSLLHLLSTEEAVKSVEKGHIFSLWH